MPHMLQRDGFQRRDSGSHKSQLVARRTGKQKRSKIMSLTDPIANMLTIIRNGLMSKKTKVDMPFSKISREILEILKREKFIKDFKFMEDEKQGLLRVYLKYTRTGHPAIKGLKKISRPGLRVYVKKDRIPVVLGGLGVAILSTSRGVVTDLQAKEMQTGGEVVCYAW